MAEEQEASKKRAKVDKEGTKKSGPVKGNDKPKKAARPSKKKNKAPA